MNAIAPSDRDRLDAHLASVDIPAVFALLQTYPDLRHTDLPGVDKATLKAIAAKPQAVRQMALGFASTSPSIRRFCKKYFPKLGALAATDLLYLFIESLDPLRPVASNADGLLGSCGGYASPLGQAIREANISMEIRRPEIEVYSDASRLAREVLDPLPSALAATDFATVLLAVEYYFGLGVFYSFTPNDYKSPIAKQSEELLAGISYHLTGAFKEVLRSRAQKGDAKLYDAMRAWICYEPLLEQECWQGTAIECVRTRFFRLRRKDVASMNLHWSAADNFAAFPQEQRTALYLLLRDSLSRLSDRDAGMMRSYSLRYYQERFPDEANQAEQMALLGTPAPTKAAAIPTKFQPETARTFSPSTTKSFPSFAVDREDALHYLLAIANLMKLHGVAKAIHEQDLGNMWKEDFPPPSSDLLVQRDEQLLQEIRQLVKERGRRISIAAIERTDFGERFLDLLQRATALPIARYENAKERGELDRDESQQELYLCANWLMQAALTFLPDPSFQQWLEIWRDRIVPLSPFASYSTFGRYDSLPQLIEARFPDEAPFLLLELQAETKWPNCDADWQRRLAQAYAQGGDRGRQTVRKNLAGVSLLSNEHYRRSDWHAPYQWLISQWWERRDSELLAIACDRCAIPMYWKGEKAYSPIVKQYRDDRGYAARTYESSDGAIAVRDICMLVRDLQPDFLAGIVRNTLQLAGDERAACTLLTCFATIGSDLTPFRACTSGLLELLESPHNYAIAAGLEIFSMRWELAKDNLSDLLLAADRALASTSTGIAKQAIECLGQLAIAYPEAREQAMASLENALYGETKSILEETLKTWKKFLAKVKSAAFPEAAIARLQELERSDPKLYGKLVQPLIANSK